LIQLKDLDIWIFSDLHIP